MAFSHKKIIHFPFSFLILFGCDSVMFLKLPDKIGNVFISDSPYHITDYLLCHLQKIFYLPHWDIPSIDKFVTL